jgi:hypothetical protein
VLGYEYEGWGCFRTDVLRTVFHNLQPGYAADGVDWVLKGRSFRTRYVSDVLRVFAQLTPNRVSNMPTVKMANGCRRWYLDVLSQDIAFFSVAPVQFVRSAVHLSRFCLLVGEPLGKTMIELRSWTAKLLFLVCIPVGLVVAGRDYAHEILRCRQTLNPTPANRRNALN